MSFETVSRGFQSKMRFKRRHFFLVPYSSGGGNKKLNVGRDLGGRKLIESSLVTGVLKPPFLDGHIDGKADDAANQGGHDTHQRFHGRPAQRSDRRLARDGVVLLEGAIGSFGCRSQAVQPAETFRSSGDFQQQAGLLGNGDMEKSNSLDRWGQFR